MTTGPAGRPAASAAAVASYPGFAGAATVIALSGELDFYDATSTRAIEGGASRLVFDLSDATFIDSTPLGALVSARKRLGAQPGRLAVVCPDEAMARIFAATGLDRRFAIYRSMEALARFGAAA